MTFKIYESENQISLPCIKQYIHPVGMGEIRYQILWKDDLGKIQVEGPFSNISKAVETLKNKLKMENIYEV